MSFSEQQNYIDLKIKEINKTENEIFHTIIKDDLDKFRKLLDEFKNDINAINYIITNINIIQAKFIDILDIIIDYTYDIDLIDNCFNKYQNGVTNKNSYIVQSFSITREQFFKILSKINLIKIKYYDFNDYFIQYSLITHSACYYINYITYLVFVICVYKNDNKFFKLIKKFNINNYSNNELNILNANIDIITSLIEKYISNIADVELLYENIKFLKENKAIFDDKQFISDYNDLTQKTFLNVLHKLINLTNENGIIQYINRVPCEIRCINNPKIFDLLIKKKYYNVITELKEYIDFDKDFILYYQVLQKYIIYHQEYFILNLDSSSIIDLGNPSKLVLQIFNQSIIHGREELAYEIITRTHENTPCSININYCLKPDNSSLFMTMIDKKMVKLLKWIFASYPNNKINYLHKDKNSNTPLIISTKQGLDEIAKIINDFISNKKIINKNNFI